MIGEGKEGGEQLISLSFGVYSIENYIIVYG